MKNESIIKESLKYIEQNLESQLTMEEIASHFGYSEYHFSRMFKEVRQISIMEYVRKRKLLRASAEIVEGQRIIEVAFRYGWSSHAGFTKAFKKEFGFSPALLKAMILQMDELGGNTMSHVFLKQTSKDATKEQLFELLKNEKQYFNDQEGIDKLNQVYQIACKAYKGMKRYSGADYINHPLNVAILLAEMEAEEDIVLAGLLCDVLQKTSLSKETLHNSVPARVENIVLGLEKFDVLALSSALDEDVIMVKLAERLHNMRTIEYMEEAKQKEKAKETLEFFLPLARKLGNEKLLEELKELTLKYVA